MPSIAETIHVTESQLSAVGSESPRLDAEVLVRHLLNFDRTRLFASLRDTFPPEQQTALDALVLRRTAGEPVSLLTGHREFFGLDFVVTPDVLTPRPETEHLVEWALAWLGQHPGSSVLDLGTGSGAIAIALANSTAPDQSITASDISSSALAIARANANRLTPNRVEFVEADLLTTFDSEFDLILANLPYLTPVQLAERAELAFEPALALVSGIDGLDAIRALVSQLARHLAPGGAVALELDPSQAITVAGMLLHTHVLTQVQAHPDLSGRLRYVTATRV